MSNRSIKKAGSAADTPSFMYVKEIGKSVKFDIGRYERRGFPEIVLATGKTDNELLEILHRVASEGHPVVISRIDHARANQLIPMADIRGEFRVVERSSMLFFSPEGWSPPGGKADGRVAIVTAGSSDMAVAGETIALLDMLGYSHDDYFDCGIAGMHRTVKAASEVVAGKYTVAIVFAGMEGALASVFASLVPIPVIGVPTSTGYGFGGGGIAALNSMLQSCIPGLVTVNIDNGVGAAAAAISIVRAARKR